MVTVVQCSWNQYITHRTYTEHFRNGHWCTGINLIQYANILSEYCVDICTKVCKEWKTHRFALINKFKSDLEHFDVANVNELRVNAYSIGIMAKKSPLKYQQPRQWQRQRSHHQKLCQTDNLLACWLSHRSRICDCLSNFFSTFYFIFPNRKLNIGYMVILIHLFSPLFFVIILLSLQK